MKHSILYDGSLPYLTAGARFEGKAGIPSLMSIHNTQLPKELIRFDKIGSTRTYRGYVHFYIDDLLFIKILNKPDFYAEKLKLFDGVISPDFSILENQSLCIQQTQTYYSRAVGYFLQKKGIPVIPNVRWGNSSSYEFCFLGIPKKSIVAISTHGCIKSMEEKISFKSGLNKMLQELEPTAVVVHGHMPDFIFEDFFNQCEFKRYPSDFEKSHLEVAA